MKQSDFSLAYALAHFTYKFDTGEIRQQKTVNWLARRTRRTAARA